MVERRRCAGGKPQEALKDAQGPSEWARLTGQALVYNALGREADSHAALAGLVAKHSPDTAYQIAEIYAYRGQTDKSFEWLQPPTINATLASPISRAVRCSKPPP